MPKVSAKRTTWNKNLGSYAQKKQKVQVVSVRELLGSTGMNVCQRTPILSGTLRPWMKKTFWGVHLRLMIRRVGLRRDTISILSDISEEEDVPTSDQNTLNNFLQKAMNNMEECIKRGRNGSAEASYAVRVGQKQARRTEYHHIQQKKRALEEGRQGGSLITNWFKPKARSHTIDVQEDTDSSDSNITKAPAEFGGSPTSTSPT